MEGTRGAKDGSMTRRAYAWARKRVGSRGTAGDREIGRSTAARRTVDRGSEYDDDDDDDNDDDDFFSS